MNNHSDLQNKLAAQARARELINDPKIAAYLPVYRPVPDAKPDAVIGKTLAIDPAIAPKDDEATRLEKLAARIEIRHFNEIKLNTECRHLVYKWIPRRGLVVVWGPPKSGKSFWIYDLLMHISRGIEYRGNHVVQGAIVYCMFEGQGGADTRAAAYANEILRGDDPGPFYDITINLDLINDHRALIMAIKAKLGIVKPVAVALDTLNRSLFGSESSDEDMAAYIRAAGAVEAEFECAVIVVHHCGHNTERPRGHSSLLGAEDAEIMVKRLADDKTMGAEVIRSKDGPEGERVTFMLKTVTVGTDKRGNDLTSCVLEPCESDLPVKGKRGAKAGGKTTWTETLFTMRKCIAEAIIKDGIKHRIMGDGAAVTAGLLETVRDLHRRKFVGDGDYEGDKLKARKENERQYWKRHLGDARKGGLVGVESVEGIGEIIWFAKEGAIK